jgi:hypothetical protein
MITEFWQLMSYRCPTKSEILRDHAAPRALAPLARPRTALTATTHIYDNSITS